MMWTWLFFISFFLNIIGLFYIRWFLKIIQTINEDIVNLSDMLSDFSQHIGSVYELEMFYGDETLQGLLDHGKDLVTTLQGLDLVLNEKEEINIDEDEEEEQKK